MGLLVGPNLVITCAHVLSNIGKKLPTQIWCDFPLAVPKQVFEGQIVYCNPDLDVAGFRINTNLPDIISPTGLIVSGDLWGHSFRVFGCPSGYPDGRWSRGKLIDRQAEGWVQIETDSESAYLIRRGYSGSPVWDDQLNGVVGLIVATDSSVDSNAAFIIPSQVFLESWPELEPFCVPVDSRKYLEMMMANYQSALRGGANLLRLQGVIQILQNEIEHWDVRIEQQNTRFSNIINQIVQPAAEQMDKTKGALQVIGQQLHNTADDYFKDREVEQAAIKEWLSLPSSRLISIIGRGGMGKTALVSRVLTELEREGLLYSQSPSRFNGIVYLSTRAAGITLERLFFDCSRLFGTAEQKHLLGVWADAKFSAEEKVEELVAYLNKAHYVILLDNLDDLLTNEGRFTDDELRVFLEKALSRSQNLRLVITSRISLTLRQELVRLNKEILLLDGLPIKDAVALLRELDPNGAFGLRDASQDQLESAVEVAHCIPRALEVMAALLANDPFLSLDELVQQFHQQKDIVQSLIQNNYQRLDVNSRRVMEALAVFRRPMPVEAIDFMLQPFLLGINLPDVVRQQIQSHILEVDRISKHVSLHPIDQDFIYSQLPDENVNNTLVTRQTFERQAANFYKLIARPQELWKTIHDLDAQFSQFDHLIRAGEYELACEVLNQMDLEYLHLWGYATKIIQMRSRLSGHMQSSTLNAINAGSLAMEHVILGEHETAKTFFYQAFALIAPHEELERQSNWFGWAGWSAYLQGDIQEAIDLYEKSLNICRTRNDLKGEGVWLGNIAIAWLRLGQIEKSIELYQRALELARSLGHRQREGVWLGWLGYCQFLLGNAERAADLLQKAYQFDKEAKGQTGQVNRLNHLGQVYLTFNNVDLALRTYEEALPIAAEIGGIRFRSYVFLGLSHCYLLKGDLAQAKLYCDQVVQFDNPENNALAALISGFISLVTDPIVARQSFERSEKICQKMLDKTSDLFETRFIQAAARTGLAVTDHRWGSEGKLPLLESAIEAYRAAIRNCSAPGVIKSAQINLNHFRNANFAGLEPLEQLLYEASH